MGTPLPQNKSSSALSAGLYLDLKWRSNRILYRVCSISKFYKNDIENFLLTTLSLQGMQDDTDIFIIVDSCASHCTSSMNMAQSYL